MSQAWLRVRCFGMGVFLAYWAVAGIVGTLTMTSAITQRMAQNERLRFAERIFDAWRLGHRAELCPTACFTQDHRQYRGIQILPEPNKKE